MTHLIKQGSTAFTLWAKCATCLFYGEWVGHDESSRNERAHWVRQHKEET